MNYRNENECFYFVNEEQGRANLGVHVQAVVLIWVFTFKLCEL
jgi:hypothetical protein